MASALGTPVKGTVQPPAQTSAKLNTSVGSGSRPGSVKMPIASSAPENPRMLDRDPPSGWLGSGKTKQQGA
jgi:hypothetical protein